MFEIQKKKKKKTVKLVSYLGILLVKMPENEAARKIARKSQENKDRERKFDAVSFWNLKTTR